MRTTTWILALCLFGLLATSQAQGIDITSAEWRLIAIGDGGPVALSLGGDAPTLAFEEGRVGGSGGCNRYMGSVTVGEHGALRFGPLASTLMACSELLMDQEWRFLQALEASRFYFFGPDGELRLFGGERLVFERVAP